LEEDSNQLPLLLFSFTLITSLTRGTLHTQHPLRGPFHLLGDERRVGERRAQHSRVAVSQVVFSTLSEW
jgi:hypothetical protein